jgi:hypothetical protein
MHDAIHSTHRCTHRRAVHDVAPTDIDLSAVQRTAVVVGAHEYAWLLAACEQHLYQVATKESRSSGYENRHIRCPLSTPVSRTEVRKLRPIALEQRSPLIVISIAVHGC